MTNLTSFVENNQRVLKQIYRELGVLTSSQYSIYTAPLPVVGGASIGAHLRHILDFYSCFYTGLKTGCIDYDDRQRSSKIENEIETALQQILNVIEQLESLTNYENSQVTVQSSVEVMNDQSIGQSNIIRELQSLHSHTTHHMAIIAIALKLNNIDVDKNFGKAPSTIKYESAQHLLNQKNSNHAVSEN